jgi:hypothetical protein
MSKNALTFDAGLARLDADAWTAQLEEIAEEFGYFEQLGPDHMAAFLDAGPKLLVTFENAETIRKFSPDAEPRGFAYAKREGWSHLALISTTESWFRDEAVYGYIDRLIDDGFFEDFDNVLFHGAHAAGYAAAAFSVAAPGAAVFVIRPQATLNPRITAFDQRYRAQRRLNFTSRYGFAPDMVEAVDRVYVAFDPLQRLDAIHAALFARKNVSLLRCTGFGWRIDGIFDAMGIHDDLMRDAMDGTLTDLTFATAMRARRENPSYIRALYSRAVQANHPNYAARMCKQILRQGPNAFFEEKLRELASQGHASAARNSAAE